MNTISHNIIKHKKIILCVFFLLVILSMIILPLVSVNYKMMDYLPEEAQSTKAINIMEEEFVSEMPNAKIMLKDVTIQEALVYKEKLAMIGGVTSITWLDDVIGKDILKTTPVDFLDEAIVANYYKDNNALISLTIKNGEESKAVKAIYDLIGDNNAATGEAISSAETQSMSVSEVVNAMMILVPIIILILIIATTSWLEPFLFLISIGVAIILNMGSNIVFGEISFITQTVSPILQLAVSLDYAIFLLHSFNSYRLTHEPEEAMVLAIKEAFPTVAASAATTVIGFAALIFMRFGIGADLGINLVKGIIISFISVIVLLPIITLMSYRLIDRTKHKDFIPKFTHSGKWLMKVRIPFLIISILLVVPSYLAQADTNFVYGMGSVTNSTRVGTDTVKVEDVFGKENPLVLIVKKEQIGKEAKLSDALSQIPHVTKVVSYATAVGAEIPTEFVPKEAVEQFYSENYTRIILYTNTSEEGDVAFNTVKEVFNVVDGFYDEYYLAGQSATLYDMKNVVESDTTRINVIAIVGIFIVLLITFRSSVLPFLLLFCIETAIWINLSFPYFSDQALSFIGYLIISTVQLGATVDYAILFTNAYKNNRKVHSTKEAMRLTIEENLVAITISAGILSITGFTLALTSTNPIISELGTLLGRGTLLSYIMVATVLPAMLVMFNGTRRKQKLAPLIAICLILSSTTAYAADEPSPKDEVIYGILHNDGSIENLYVVNIFEGGSIIDYGEYSDVNNLTSAELLQYEHDQISFTTTENKFYYQGTLVNQQLPWLISLQYVLNGQKISAEELAGKSGQLVIDVEITANKEVQETFYENYALQLSLLLDQQLCSNILADNATIAEVGSKKQLTFTILPGNNFKTNVTTDIHDFEMDPISINGIKLSLGMEIDSGTFTQQLGELKEGIEQLDIGAKDLLDGIDQLSIGMDKYVKGIETYAAGMDEFALGIADLNKGAISLSEGLTAITQQNESLINGAKAIEQSTFDAVNQTISDMGLQLPLLTAENYHQILAPIKELSAIETQLDGAVQFTQGLIGYTEGVSQLGIGAVGLAEGTTQFKTSTEVLASSADEIYQGGVELNGAIASIREGLTTYKEGTGELREGTSNMDIEMETQIKEMIDSIVGTSEPVVSFVSNKNTQINAVQFVLKTEGIQLVDEEKPIEELPEKLNFWEKFLQLFDFLKIFGIAFPFANSSINLSR